MCVVTLVWNLIRDEEYGLILANIHCKHCLINIYGTFKVVLIAMCWSRVSIGITSPSSINDVVSVKYSLFISMNCFYKHVMSALPGC